MRKVLITGISSGIGLGLAEKYLLDGYQVFGLSRRKCPVVNENLFHVQADLADFANIPGKMFELFEGLDKLDLVILNAGMLGSIADMADAELGSMKQIMDVNLWSNKVILDWLFKHVGQVEQVIAISSGAAVNGSRGWSGYSLSKAALNMLMMLYASERDTTHFCALAPGLVDTAMQDYLCAQPETEKFSSLARIQNSRGTEAMPTPEELAKKLPTIIEQLKNFDSGCFKDIRQL